ncbi:MAG TPA: PilN domain-containing protein [Terriglobales bacterium]
MIRINLLGAPKPKSKRGGSAPAVTLEVAAPSSPKIKILLVLVLVAVANGAYWMRLDKQKQALVAKTQAAEDQNRKLSDVKAKYLERQKQAESYKRRVDVIDQLRVNQAGPVNLLDTLGDTVNNTEAVWLFLVKDSGPSVDINGMALSTDAVASLITNLQKTGYFKNIEIKETYQDEQYKEMQAFQFTLTCEKGKS